MRPGASAAVVVLSIARLAQAQDISPYARPETLGWPEAPELAAPPNEALRPSTRFSDRRLAFAAMFGLGTPVGLMGVIAEYTLIEHIALAVGFGTNARSPQLAANINLRPLVWNRPRAAHGVSVSSSYAIGRWEPFILDFSLMDHRGPEARSMDQHYVNERARWFQLDVGYEARTRHGIVFRMACGVAWMLNPGDATCERRDGTAAICGEGAVRGARPDAAVRVFVTTIGYAF